MTLRPIQDTFVIPLTQGQVARVDERDFYRLRKYTWCARWDPSIKSFYAARSILHPHGGTRPNGTGRRESKQSMHREICGLRHGDPGEVDHIDHDTLDNRREKLRVVTRRQNMANSRNQSRYGVGICFEPRSKRRPFVAHVWIEKRLKRIGCFATADEAREARRKYIEDRGLA